MQVNVYDSTVSAGFPTPADDYASYTIDLNRELIKDRSATFFIYAPDDSMNSFGIFKDDLIVLEKGSTKTNDYIALLEASGDFLIRHVRKTRDGRIILSTGKSFIVMDADNIDFRAIGTVKYVIHGL